MLRELTMEETGFVSGGVGVDDTRSWKDGTVQFRNGDSWGDQLYGVGQWLADRIMNFFGSDFTTDAERMRASEQAISEKFNQTTPSESGQTDDGRTWAKGTDGWRYVDTDGNGVFDQRIRGNADGSISVDYGDRTQLVRY
jgi:hypothetical protein